MYRIEPQFLSWMTSATFLLGSCQCYLLFLHKLCIFLSLCHLLLTLRDKGICDGI